jgi:putative oxidoreductase
MQWLNTRSSARQVNGGLLLLRTVLGTIFIAHGAQKVFVYGMPAIAGGFAEMGIPLAAVMGPAVSLAELGGGVAILLGLFTRAAGAGLAATMLGAIVFAHLSGGFFAPDGIEFPLMLLAAASALAVMGGGAWSVDALPGRRMSAGAQAGAEAGVAERSLAKAA